MLCVYLICLTCTALVCFLETAHLFQPRLQSSMHKNSHYFHPFLRMFMLCCVEKGENKKLV